MWLFIVLTLNVFLGCHVWKAEAKLKDGDCEGQCQIYGLTAVYLQEGTFLTRMAYS